MGKEILNSEERIKKLETLPWQALHDVAIKKGIAGKVVNNKEKEAVIQTLLSYSVLSDQEIEQLVDDYIYGDRITFTLWNFQRPLEETEINKLKELENVEEEYLYKGFRKLKILSIKDISTRLEVLYVYSKEYMYIDEVGHNASVWEQHRGCLWIGKDATYLACISKHEKMTAFITKFIAEKISNVIMQIKPPKVAYEKCTDFKAISRIVLQGNGGEKTIVSRSGGLTYDQQEEIKRIRAERMDVSGSYIAGITEDVEATVRYNVRKGSLGIYKHLSSAILFEWSENAIKIILSEIEALKGKAAEEIYKEVGQDIKWNSVVLQEKGQLNWYLTQIIASLDKEGSEIQIPDDKKAVLEEQKLFIRLPRVYCNQCESYEIPYCANCGKSLVSGGGLKRCSCGTPLRLKCSEGHEDCEIVYWYVPRANLIKMINRNIRKVYGDYDLNYNMCIIGDMLYISMNDAEVQEKVEISFGEIECFKSDAIEISERIRKYAVNLNEKCDRTCSRPKVEKCVESKDMVCLPKLFYSILPSYRPQPHKGGEYGDVAAEIKVGNRSYELKGIIKKNSRNLSNKMIDDTEKIQTPLLSTSKEGQEIIRQFVEQGLSDNRCEVIAVIIPQYIDASLKGTLRFLARLAHKKVSFFELDEVCNLIAMNEMINIT